MSDGVGPTTAAERFEPRTETVRDARRFVSRVLGGLGEVADDAALLVSELATNAVIHAGTVYTVTVRQLGPVVRVEVADGSPGTARRCRYSPTSGTGRGLGMVEDLSSGWGAEEDGAGAGKIVWFELPVPSAGAATRSTSMSADHAATDADLDALLDELGGWDEDDADADSDSDSDGSPPPTAKDRRR